MDFRTISTEKRKRRASAGFTLSEVVFTVGITALCLGALAMFFVFSTHSFTTLYNYVDLDDANRLAIDQLTRDVRQADRVKSFTANSLTLQDANGIISYIYNPRERTFTRTVRDERSGIASAPTVLLNECDRLSFVLGQRTPMANSMEVYTNATPLTAKVVNVSWSCSRQVLGHKEESESVQTARIVIRKQGT